MRLGEKPDSRGLDAFSFFFSSRVLFKNRIRFPRVFEGFLKRFGSQEWNWKVPLEIQAFGSFSLDFQMETWFVGGKAGDQLLAPDNIE